MLLSVGALALGGLVGVLGRWALVLALPAGALPWGTLAVNLSGCLLIGLFDALIARRGFGGAQGRLMLVTGFCGGYTTFSALILELDALLAASPARAFVYVAASVLAGLALFRAGHALGGA